MPQLAGRQSGALRQRVEFCKGEAGIGEVTQAAIGAGDDVFFADEFGKADDAQTLVPGLAITHLSQCNMRPSSGRHGSQSGA